MFSSCQEAFDYLESIRGSSHVLGDGERRGRSEGKPGFQPRHDAVDPLASWNGRAWNVNQEIRFTGQTVIQPAWDNREYYFPGKTQQQITRFSVVSSFPTPAPISLLPPNSQRRAFCVIMDPSMNPFVFGPIGVCNSFTQGLTVESTFGLNYVLLTDRDWGGWVCGAWEYVAECVGNMTVIEDLYLV